MEPALIIDLILFGVFTVLLVLFSIDEARQEKRAKKALDAEELKKAS